MGTQDDARSVQATLAGETAAFAVLYDRYAPLIRAICYETARSVPQAQDLAQDVFLRAFAKLGQLREPGQFASWLIGIARLRCREWQRESAQQRQRYSNLEQVDPPAPPAADSEDLEALRRAIADLPEHERLALHLFYLQEQPVEAAQQAMQLSRSGFYRLLERARGRLQQLMQYKQEGIR